MRDALAEMLPLAVAVAISPIPILAVILMLLTERSTANAVALLAGWVAAILVIGGAVAALGIGRANTAEDPGTGLIVAQFVLAAILLAGAVRRWRMRARADVDHETPRWMSAVRSVRPPSALVLGLGLIALNPKDGLLTVAAGARLAESEVDTGSAAI